MNIRLTCKAKQCIYWIGYLLLLSAGIWLSAANILSVCNTLVFLLGLYWLWNSITLVLSCNPSFAQKYPRHTQFHFAVSAAGLGIVWIGISFFALSNRALPMLIVSLPFVIWMAVLHARRP